MSLNLFGIFKLDDNNRYVKRIDSNGELSKKVATEFESQLHNFFYCDGKEKEKRLFEPTWTSNEDNEVFFVEEFDDVIGFNEAIGDPSRVDQFNPREEMSSLKGIFAVIDSNPEYVLFQSIDHSHLFLRKKEWWMVYESGNSNTFVRNDQEGLRLDTKLAAVYHKRKLYFLSYYHANRILDLSLYLKEATTENVISFLTNKNIETPKNHTTFAKTFSTTQRKLVSQAIACGYLDKLTPAVIVAKAKMAKAKIPLELNNGKLVLPTDSDGLAKVLRFLSNKILQSYLDQERDFEANSTRPI